MRGLERVLEETDFAWSLGLVGEDQAAKLAKLAGDFRCGASPSGDGKRIASGFSYLGTEPAIAWTRACRDPLYPVMKESIESFSRRWTRIKPCLNDASYHYVSLGPGDGQKDSVIFRDLTRINPRACYVPVDMSAEMLRMGSYEVIRQLGVPPSRILPVQLDFSAQSNLIELRRMLQRLFGDGPLLFSLLGNTMANFENDTDLLRMLGKLLLRPCDRFVLEVATTSSLGTGPAQAAANEYGRSRAFREFVTSALLHYTDLHIDMDSVLFHGSVEGTRALLVKMIYRNQTARTLRITLPDRTDVPFPNHDTIRLYTTRKYAQDNLGSVLSESGVTPLLSTRSDFFATFDGLGFAMDLLIVVADPDAADGPARTSLEDIWQG
jgi:uncharacterized SAM-dependent methyltransferase